MRTTRTDVSIKCDFCGKEIVRSVREGADICQECYNRLPDWVKGNFWAVMHASANLGFRPKVGDYGKGIWVFFNADESPCIRCFDVNNLEAAKQWAIDVNEEGHSDSWFEDIYINGIPQELEMRTTLVKIEEGEE